ncbi:ATP-dependent helicase HrpA [Ereboglobus sp. PH5-5]|uniref:DUF3418 domain-containing protein n=1 Tax=Ereboglobus sp. PH5-5 TaxID=2940529 RepID=UPI002406CC74|nr:DUF3418 domain-containing protein [Ereboglobus sp. PH5-5]MDF9833557.1 ATP-dependent helicase HrpA [Ereboglobus sp. PH5-5]
MTENLPDSSQPPFPFRLEFPPELPISARADEITAAIAQNQVVILAGETGSGKTTQIPKMCLAAGRGSHGQIACTQPRRVAALSISRRVAEELNVNWGREVGCKIRFDDRTSRATVIKFMTDGMLLAEVQSDPMLRAYDTVILDEAHERSLNIDFLLGHLRNLRFKRPELKIIITSATIDTEMFSKAFDDAPIIEVSGRTYPVEVIYAPLDDLGSDSASDENDKNARAEALHYIDGAVEAVERIVRETGAGAGGAGGDILVFMPAERDIRETTDLLEGRGRSASARLKNCEIIPLFGRLSSTEQQRVFAPTQRRKIVISTNIAETSLTIPGIRFVVDTGLARVSRYAPQARTRRLPIEEIAQSSADQRKGRCGRVAEGVCVRLYSENDYNDRPRFAQPEIQRANLADVILRMKAFGLGDIERFPFINMPAAKSIRAGYALLEELGALEEARRPEARVPESQKTDHSAPPTSTSPTSGTPASGTLVSGLLASGFPASSLTPIGRELARLPVDPTVGRMILEARKEKCVREVAVIAAGLSIQDPRERPLEKQAQADAAHRRFAHADSDFLTLLNIWETFHDQFETMTQSRLRKFCREHFLSYTRMREWRDIHAQLLEVLTTRNDFRKQPSSVADGLDAKRLAREGGVPLHYGTPAYRAIHRSILSGLLGNIALRDDERGGYKSTHDRRVAIFPGSVLFTRDEPKRKDASSTRGNDARNKKPPKSPAALMAAEIMETTRLYARTCARIDPQWAIELGEHLLKRTHSEPFWDGQKGRVLVKQRTRLHGLELETRAVGYGKINPREATEIFIREALVNDTITWPFDFLIHNRAIREKVEDLLTRARDNRYMNLDEGVYRFYAGHLACGDSSPLSTGRFIGPQSSGSDGINPAVKSGDESPHSVSSVPELITLVRERKPRDPHFLEMQIEDLRAPEELRHDTLAFPETVPLENRALPLSYAYKPGQADDGVTIQVNIREAEALTPAALDWAVPGHLEAKVEHHLRAVPKELRRAFMPLAETAKTLAAQITSRDRLTGRRETIAESLAAQIAERFNIQIPVVTFAQKPLPDHLRVRVRVLDDDGGEICASRELDEIRAALGARTREVSAAVSRDDPAMWKRARKRHEKPPAETWAFGDIPGRIIIGDLAGVPVEAYPGLSIGLSGTGDSPVGLENAKAKNIGGSPAPHKPHGRAARATPPPDDGVSLRLFRTPETAREETRRGLFRLLELHLKYELAWTERDLAKSLRALAPLAASFLSFEKLQAGAFALLRRHICDPARVRALTASAFAAAATQATHDVRTIIPRLTELLREILTARVTLQVLPGAHATLARDAASLVSENFLQDPSVTLERLSQFPRYLKAMRLRAERHKQNPAKDAERAKQLAPYEKAAASLAADPRPEAQTFRWLVEEFRVSLFAQELGTAEPVSAVKLDRALAALRKTGAPPFGAAAAPAPAAAPPPKPLISMTPSPGKKSAPLKSLNALDSFFKR